MDPPIIEIEPIIDIEHIVGVYILLVGIACIVGIAAKRLTQVPYTIALVLVGLALAVFKIGPSVDQAGFSKELVFLVLLPPLLFQGSLHMQLDRLRKHALAVAVFATVGVLLTTLIIGWITWAGGAFDSLGIAMLFGALICTTDPVSVLAIFRRIKVPPDLKYLVEGESLFNDGTGVVVFTIVLNVVLSGVEFSAVDAVVDFLRVSIGGAGVGIAVGAICYFILRRLNDHLLENAICLVACYASFWCAEHLHFSGVISTVCAGLLLGNYGRQFAMNPKTIETVETFFESIDFLINSLLFILIGLELKELPAGALPGHLWPLLLVILAMLVGRLVVYPLFFLTRGRGDAAYPAKWSHVIFWGGLRGSIPIALLLGLPNNEALAPYRMDLLVLGFGVVCFSLVFQGLTMKPLIGYLKISAKRQELKEDPAHQQEGLG